MKSKMGQRLPTGFSTPDIKPNSTDIETWMQNTTATTTKTTTTTFSVSLLPIAYYSKDAFSSSKKALLQNEMGEKWFDIWNRSYLCIDVISYQRLWISNARVRHKTETMLHELIGRKNNNVCDWNCILQTCFNFGLFLLFEYAYDEASKQFPNHPLLLCVQ